MDSDFSRLSRLQRRNAALESDDEEFPAPSTLSPIRVPLLAPRRAPRISHSLQHPHPRPPPTPSTGMPSSLPQHSLPLSAPASPPTPIPTPSPKPHQRIPVWGTRDEEEDSVLADAKFRFSQMEPMARQRHLRDLLSMCDMQQLSFVHHFVSPRLKKDPFRILPTELCLEILRCVDDPKTLARASQVSRRWHEVLSDDSAWRVLCERRTKRPRPGGRTFKSHFKKHYMVEAAWRKGGDMMPRPMIPDQGVVTSLHLTKKYIVVALDTAKIHVYNTRGVLQRTLLGHVMGVWAMVPWGDILVSGGCDRDVRVWNMATGASVHTLRGHTSTVRCLKMSDANTAISGSRDTQLRVWDITTGQCKAVLAGHQASVRCLEIHGDLVVSGSYDTTAKIWSISQGVCLRTLQGHFSQIYAIAFDGNRIATGSLDTSVRIWDPHTGSCQAILQGHTSLVGQLQMRDQTLVTGGSDGSVRVWSLNNMLPIHRLAAHDNSVTSLQFDETRIVSGGSDGRVKIWNLKTGALIRELSQPAEAVWRVAFEEEKAVIMASRGGKTIMEVWSFAPPPGSLLEDSSSEEAPLLPDEVHTGFGAIGEERARKRVQREEQNVDMMDVAPTNEEDDVVNARFSSTEDRTVPEGDAHERRPNEAEEFRSQYVMAQKNNRNGF